MLQEVKRGSFRPDMTRSGWLEPEAVRGKNLGYERAAPEGFDTSPDLQDAFAVHGPSQEHQQRAHASSNQVDLDMDRSMPSQDEPREMNEQPFPEASRSDSFECVGEPGNVTPCRILH